MPNKQLYPFIRHQWVAHRKTYVQRLLFQAWSYWLIKIILIKSVSFFLLHFSTYALNPSNLHNSRVSSFLVHCIRSRHIRLRTEHPRNQILLGCYFPSKIKNLWCFKPPASLVGQKTCPLHEILTQLVITEKTFSCVFSNNQPCQYFMEGTGCLASQRYSRLTTS